MQTYRTDRVWADRYIPAQLAALCHLDGGVSAEEAAEADDIHRAVDFWAVMADGTKKGVAARVRGNEYLRYADVTIRGERASGTRAEGEKIAAGCADWAFYAWATANASELAGYIVYDLDRFRERIGFDHGAIGSPIPNTDGETEFYPVPLWLLDAEGCIIAKRGTIPPYTSRRQDERKPMNHSEALTVAQKALHTFWLNSIGGSICRLTVRKKTKRRVSTIS